jgi:hypothetical protein
MIRIKATTDIRPAHENGARGEPRAPLKILD